MAASPAVELLGRHRLLNWLLSRRSLITGWCHTDHSSQAPLAGCQALRAEPRKTAERRKIKGLGFDSKPNRLHPSRPSPDTNARSEPQLPAAGRSPSSPCKGGLGSRGCVGHPRGAGASAHPRQPRSHARVLARGRRSRSKELLQLVQAGGFLLLFVERRSQHELCRSVCSPFCPNTSVNKYYSFRKRKTQLDAEGSDQLLINAPVPTAASPALPAAGEPVPSDAPRPRRQRWDRSEKAAERESSRKSKSKVLASEKRGGGELLGRSFSVPLFKTSSVHLAVKRPLQTSDSRNSETRAIFDRKAVC